MSKISPDPPKQQVQRGNAGHNFTQVGGNYNQTSNSNNRIIISLVVMVAFGGLAITAYVAKDLINRPQKPDNTEIQVIPIN